MREYGIAAPSLAAPEPVVSRRSAERLAAVVPDAHVVVRHGHVESGFLGVGYRAGAWLPVGERHADGTSDASPSEASSEPGESTRPVPVERMHGRAECSVIFAPDAYPHVWAHDWIARSPVLVLRSETARVELDLSGLSADDALAFIASFRATLDVYACLWEEWESRAEFDQARPYPIPPPMYGDPDNTGDGGDASGDVPAGGVRESGDVPGGSGGGL